MGQSIDNLNKYSDLVCGNISFCTLILTQLENVSVQIFTFLFFFSPLNFISIVYYRRKSVLLSFTDKRPH